MSAAEGENAVAASEFASCLRLQAVGKLKFYKSSRACDESLVGLHQEIEFLSFSEHATRSLTYRRRICAADSRHSDSRGRLQPVARLVRPCKLRQPQRSTAILVTVRV
jgi:hypothetical protein